jgi:uncharacterized protein (DUF433 family)
MTTALKGIIHGKTIELEQEPGFHEGQEVSVEIQPINPPKMGTDSTAPWWLAHLEVNPTVRPGKFVVKGTHLLADDMVAHLEEGWDEEKLLQAHPELAPEDVTAVREFAKLPPEMRRSFGAWAEDAEELDKYLEWNRQRRKVSRKEIDD